MAPNHWLEVHWPQTDGSPNPDLYVWFNDKEAHQVERYQPGDKVVFYATRYNPDPGGSPGPGAVFATGTISNSPIEKIDQRRGDKRYSFRKKVQVELFPHRTAWLPRREVNRAAGWDEKYTYQQARVLSQAEFDAISAELSRRAEKSELRYCRVCWNTKGWQRPTRNAAGLEVGSYVAENEFGHEEWLFNYGFMINGHQHGFLEPINKDYPAYVGRTFDIRLYSRSAAGLVWIGEIRKCRVIDEKEAKAIRAIYEKRGWLDEMAAQLRVLGINPGPLFSNDPPWFSNVCFEPENAVLYDPYVEIPRNHFLWAANRYKLYNAAEGDNLSVSAPAKPKALPTGGKRKDEARRRRRAIGETEFDPIHDRIQNDVTDLLEQEFGADSVMYEANYVDIVVHEQLPSGPRTTLFEVKNERSARLFCPI